MKRKKEAGKKKKCIIGNEWQQSDQDRNIIRQQWPALSLWEKLRYIGSYYGIAFVVLAIVIGCAVFFISDIYNKKTEDAFFVMVVDLELTEDETASMQEELSGLLGLDPQTQRCVIEAGYSSTANMQSEATVAAYMRSGRTDLVIASEEDFNRYAVTGYLSPLADIGLAGLEDDMEEDRLFYAQQIDYSKGGAVTEIPFHPHEKKGTSDCYGIYLKDGRFRGYVIGAMANCPHSASVKAGMQYFLDLK